ncbi:Uncharacterised protein [Mycobacteroides abscessus]|nr:Uncharacterised protein [Mycobacteroides abscessus]SII91976.1 Uncharacterised protein [Mycobacteroides abscessus subsp. abscessus]
MVSAMTLSEAFIISRSRSISGADCTEAIDFAVGGAASRRTASGSTPSAAASARPASRAGVVERRES